MQPADQDDFDEVLCVATEFLTLIQGVVPVDHTTWGSIKSDTR
jgi:hypothetical protein